MTRNQVFPAFKTSALALAVSAAVNFSPWASAQDEVQELEEITVTGTRIRMTDGMAAPTPVTSLTPAELLTFEPGGTVAEQLDALPQFFNTGTAQRGGNALFGDGAGSYLNMRGLGRNRTLVLLDGSRVPPADKRGTVNVDNFPTALVRSVDVVTGGASAAYGADALGGVTNFVIDREFEGLKFSASTGMNEFNQDGRNWNFSIAGGRQFGDRLNVIGSVEAREIDEIYRAAEELDADWYQNYGYVTNPAWNRGDPPGTNPERIVVPWVVSRSSNASGIIRARGSALDGLTFTDDGSGIRPFVLGDVSDRSSTSGGPEAQRELATSGPITGAGVAQRSGFVGLQYALSDTFSVFGQALVGRTESTNVAEHATFAMGGPPSYYLTIYRDNPFLPEQVAAVMDAEGRDLIQLSKGGSVRGNYAPGAFEFTKTVFTTASWQLGFDAVLPNGWDLRGSWQSGETRKRGGEYPSIRVDREALSRDAVRDPATGAIVCNVQLYNPTPEQLAQSPSVQGIESSRGGPLYSPIGRDNSVRDCVPYNAMGAEGMSYEAWNYIHTVKIANSLVEQDFAEIIMTGELYEGWGYGPLSFATGFTWREQSFADEGLPLEIDKYGPPRNDPALGIRGIPSYYSAADAAKNLHQFSTIENISGKYDVWEWFGELQLPIWESASGAQRLGGNVAYRSSDYSSSGRSESWKLGMEFQVFEDLRLRGTKSRDVREASFAERFDFQTSGATVDNPWTGATGDNPTVVAGGNPNLRPEIADTLVFGAVYQPGWLGGLQVSADWYEVDLADAVEVLGTDDIIDRCYMQNVLCDNVIRDARGSIVRVLRPYMNLANARVEGVDFEMVYRLQPDFFGDQFESLSLRAIVGHLMEKSETAPGGTPVNQVGGTFYPENTGNLTASYSVGPWSIQWQQRFIDEALYRTTWVEGVDIDDNTIPFYTWTNARFSYQGELGNGGTWNLGLNISNMFNKNPPIIPSTRGQGAASSYDEYGRRYQLSLNMTF